VNLPNTLTLLRIFLVPLLVIVLLTRTQGGLLAGTGIFGLGVLTDYLDGYLARRRKQVTRLGILLDPLADKLLTAAAFLALLEMDAVPGWMVLIIIGRELGVTGLRNVAWNRGILIPASALGKAKMVLQVVAIFALLLARRFPVLEEAGLVVLWVAVLVTLVSALDYIVKFGRGAVSGRREAPGEEAQR
jgi:CDP-diacylglycerol--glycerol-3-phosphate 3-phosphatidyltransferase